MIPKADWVLVKPEKLSTTLVMPDIVKAERTYGTVVAVGLGCVVDGKLIKPDLEVGARIVFFRNRGFGWQVVEISRKKGPKEQMILVRYSEVLAELDSDEDVA